MALKTQGFVLSAMPRAPAIPANAGAVDVKQIYDGVRQGLAAFETARRAPASMLLADAEMKAKTAEAPMQTAILAESVEQAPVKTRNLLAQTRQIEAETTPEFLNAKMKHLLMSVNPAGVREFELLTAGMAPADKERARRIHFGLDPRTSGAAITYREVIGEDGKTRLVAVDPRAVGAHVVGTGQTYGSGVPTPGVAPAIPAIPSTPASMIPGSLNLSPSAPITEGAAIPSTVPIQTPTATAQNAAPTAPSPFASPTAQERKFQEITGSKSAEIIQEAKEKLPKARTSLEALEAKTRDVEQAIDKAIRLTSGKTAGIAGALTKSVPGSDALTLATLLETIGANIGFDALADMRVNSPTGGALGNVSDRENESLRSTIRSLIQNLDPAELKENLLKVKEVRRETLARWKNAFERDVHKFGLTDADFSAAAKAATAPITGTPQEAAPFKIVEIK